MRGEGQMMAGAGWGAEKAGPGSFECGGDLLGSLGQIWRGLAAKKGAGHWRGFAAMGGGGPWHGESWQRKTESHRGAGHWGGGFGGPWGGWWPGAPGPQKPPWAQKGPKAGRGDVRAAILALLREGPRNGYQIMSDIEERSGGAWRPSPGAVYPALSQLADEGLVVGEESGGRRTYSLTDAGREYVEQNPDMARGAWESEAQQEAWQLPGLLAEAARLGGGIMQLAHAGTPEQVRAAERLLEQTRRALYRILADDEGADEPDAGEQEI
ncbi:MAG TPA: PadR family transcriptional regulator [Streptosporangiaceae bacterium]|nr:PadR family transcriptional regulator [Streptosporangiaceae bacterium]